MTKAKSINKNIEEKIKNIIGKIRPSLQMDGGDVEFINWDEGSGTVKVSLVGMCAHCPMSGVTLKQGIEAELKKAVKGVKEVVAV